MFGCYLKVLKYFEMGVCFLQHRVVAGTNGKQYLYESKYCSSTNSLLTGWYKYFKYISSGSFSILFGYLIILTFAILVDIGARRMVEKVPISARSHIPHMDHILLSTRTLLNQGFIILLTLLYKKLNSTNGYPDRVHTKVSLHKMFKSLKVGMICKLGYLYSFWL